MDSISLQANNGERNRKRSRSPHQHHRRDEVKRPRSQSPYRKHHRHRRRDHDRSHEHPSAPTSVLPYAQRTLDKSDLKEFKVVLAYYLHVQKSLEYSDLPPDEIKGRWKSFMGKWNRGELAQGWYDPDTKSKADEYYTSRARDVSRTEREEVATTAEHVSDEQDDDEYGPALPKASLKSGPSIPSMDDLQHRRELAEEDDVAHMADLRHSRKQDRSVQKERLDELAPRADPGSRERQLEKKRDATAVNRAFRDAKEAGDVDVGESELMGDDGIAGYKAKLKAREKVKNEREIRKEEVLRARAAEREERMRAVRAKEEKTIEMLRGLARQRFG